MTISNDEGDDHPQVQSGAEILMEGNTLYADGPSHLAQHRKERTDWVPHFVAWAEGRVDTLDFHGKVIPRRLYRLLTALVPAEHVLDLREEGWSLQHPLPCRPHLAECPLNLRIPGVADDLVLMHKGQAYRRWRITLNENRGIEVSPYDAEDLGLGDPHGTR